MIILKRSFTILIIALLLFTIFNVNSNTIDAKTFDLVNINPKLEKSDFDGYIIQFIEEPLLRFKNRFTERIKNFFSHLSVKITDILLSCNVQKHKEKLLTLHMNAKEDISKITRGSLSSKKIFSRDFINVFNGISIKKISEEHIDEIKELPYVKDIFPNYKISVTLDGSIPLINADDVWSIENTYGESFTGQGITIAFLDTGVDYNHPLDIYHY